MVFLEDGKKLSNKEEDEADKFAADKLFLRKNGSHFVLWVKRRR